MTRRTERARTEDAGAGWAEIIDENIRFVDICSCVLHGCYRFVDISLCVAWVLSVC